MKCCTLVRDCHWSWQTVIIHVCRCREQEGAVCYCRYGQHLYLSPVTPTSYSMYYVPRGGIPVHRYFMSLRSRFLFHRTGIPHAALHCQFVVRQKNERMLAAKPSLDFKFEQNKKLDNSSSYG